MVVVPGERGRKAGGRDRAVSGIDRRACGHALLVVGPADAAGDAEAVGQLVIGLAVDADRLVVEIAGKGRPGRVAVGGGARIVDSGFAEIGEAEREAQTVLDQLAGHLQFGRPLLQILDRDRDVVADRLRRTVEVDRAVALDMAVAVDPLHFAEADVDGELRHVGLGLHVGLDEAGRNAGGLRRLGHCHLVRIAAEQRAVGGAGVEAGALDIVVEVLARRTVALAVEPFARHQQRDSVGRLERRLHPPVQGFAVAIATTGADIALVIVAPFIIDGAAQRDAVVEPEIDDTGSRPFLEPAISSFRQRGDLVEFRVVGLEQHSAGRSVASEQRALRPFQDLRRPDVEEVGVEPIGTGNVHFIEIDPHRGFERRDIIGLDLAADGEREGRRAVAAVADGEARREARDLLHFAHTLVLELRSAEGADRDRGGLDVGRLLGDADDGDHHCVRGRVGRSITRPVSGLGDGGRRRGGERCRRGRQQMAHDARDLRLHCQHSSRGASRAPSKRTCITRSTKIDKTSSAQRRRRRLRQRSCRASTGTSARARSTSFRCVQPSVEGSVSMTAERNCATSRPIIRVAFTEAPGHSRKGRISGRT